MAAYVHHTPGRLRVRTAAIKRNEKGAAAVRELLASHAGVRDCTANTVTGSLLIRYDADLIAPDRLLEWLRSAGYCCDQTVLPARGTRTQPKLSQGLSQAGSAVSRTVMGVLVEKAVERSAVALIGAIL